MSLWEINVKESSLEVGRAQLLSLLYGIHLPSYDSQKELNKKINEIKKEKIYIIKDMIITEILNNYNKKLKDCNVIEIGPGAGIMLDWLAPKVNHLHCLDISKSILESCYSENQQHENVSYHFIEGSLELSSLKNIDFVYSQSVFIHLSVLDFYVYFEELYNCLKPGGLIYIDIINSDDSNFSLQEKEYQNQLSNYKALYNTDASIKTLYHANSLSVLTKIAKDFGYSLIWSQNSINNSSNVSLIFRKNK